MKENKKTHLQISRGDGNDFFCEMQPYSERGLDYLGTEALKKFGISRSRKDMTKVDCEVFEISLKAGVQQKRKIGTFEFLPPAQKITTEEFRDEMREALADVPEAFHSYIAESSWDRGHSCGMEEVISCAREMCAGILPCIKEFIKNNS